MFNGVPSIAPALPDPTQLKPEMLAYQQALCQRMLGIHNPELCTKALERLQIIPEGFPEGTQYRIADIAVMAARLLATAVVFSPNDQEERTNLVQAVLFEAAAMKAEAEKRAAQGVADGGNSDLQANATVIRAAPVMEVQGFGMISGDAFVVKAGEPFPDTPPETKE